MSLSTEQIQINRPAIIDETIDNEVVVVDLYRGSYFSIRGAGVDIWRLLSEPTTRDAVVTGMATRFGRPEADISATVQRFVSELDGHGLLKPSDEIAANALAVDPPGGDVPIFQAPSLEKFTDMEDLLLLDPVHDVDGRGWPHPGPH
jgi:hypothetical protein